jgi:Ca2+-transporting ATPase
MNYQLEMNDMVDEVATLDFSSERKTMSKIVQNYHGRQGNVVLLKGAAERVVDRCNKVINSEGKETNMTDKERASFKQTILDQAS